MTYTPSTLPAKFHPYVLGSPSCSAPPGTKEEIDEVFKQKESPVSMKGGYIFNAGNWILKLNRTDGLPVTADSFLYRICKADKIRRHIFQKGLQNDFVVPQKFLYWNESQSCFYVVCQKIPLSKDVAQPSAELLPSLQNERSEVEKAGGQMLALLNGATQRPLTPVQAKELAELAFLGYTDQTYNNLYFTPEGKVAIIDTEPVKRVIKKNAFQFKPLAWLPDKGSIKLQQSFTGTAKLKASCSDPLAVREIEKVEKPHALWGIAKLVGKIAIVALVFVAILHAMTALALSGLVAFGVGVLLGALAVKTLLLALNIHSVAMMWRNSHQGLQGLGRIGAIERMGLI